MDSVSDADIIFSHVFKRSIEKGRFEHTERMRKRLSVRARNSEKDREGKREGEIERKEERKKRQSEGGGT